MPMRVTTTDGGLSYIDIRVGEGHTIHQRLLDVSNLYDDTDADGYLPPGLGLTGTNPATLAHASGTTVYLIGPEPVYIGKVTSTVDVFGNVIAAGGVNGDAIADNVGTALAAAPANIIVF
jgi:hypothetical protein